MKKYELNGKFYSSSEINCFLHPSINDSKMKRGRVKSILDIIDLEFESLLDIGSHLGGFLQLMEQLNLKANKLYGLECYEPSIVISKKFVENDKIKFFLHDCQKLPFEDKSFDVVTFFEVLEHVRDLDFFLKEVNRVLNDNGIIYLSVPNATWWRNLAKDIVLNKYKYAEKMENWPNYTPDQRDHINNFNFIHLYRILNLNGFKLDYLDYYDQSNSFIFNFPYMKNLSSTIIMKLQKSDDVK